MCEFEICWNYAIDMFPLYISTLKLCVYSFKFVYYHALHLIITNYHIVLKSIYDYAHYNSQSTCTFTMYYTYHFQQHCNFEKAISVKTGTRSVHVGSRKKISEVSQVISGFVMPHLLHYSVTLYLLHLQICLLGNTLVPISSHPARSQNGM